VEAVVAAVITALGTIIAALITSGRRENGHRGNQQGQAYKYTALKSNAQGTSWLVIRRLIAILCFLWSIYIVIALVASVINGYTYMFDSTPALAVTLGAVPIFFIGKWLWQK
jgi:hypothetical protein